MIIIIITTLFNVDNIFEDLIFNMVHNTIVLHTANSLTKIDGVY